MAKPRDPNLPQHDINQGHFGEIDLSLLPDSVKSGGGGGTSGEVLMADGVANPPEPLTSEDGSDWLYEG